MQTPEEIRRDLPADLDRAEGEALVATAMELQALRPAPAAGFQSELRRRLSGTPQSRPSAMPRPEAVARRGARAIAFASAVSGLALLAIAAIGLAGAGPFAAG